MRTLILLLLFASTAYASEYMIENPDGTVKILIYNDGARKSIGQVLVDNGDIGKPVRAITKADYPSDKSDRKYWKANPNIFGPKMVIDTPSKQADEAAEQNRKNKVRTARQKICPSCTDEEFEDALSDI